MTQKSETTNPQCTLARTATFSGVGIHTGERATLTFHPAPADHGVVFVRTDLPGSPPIKVEPGAAKLSASGMRRTILSAGVAEVHTAEHVLSALSGIGVDNCLIEIDAMEAPEPEDGSSLPIVRALREAGLRTEDTPRRPFVIEEPIAFQDGSTHLLALPHEGFRLSFTIVYDNPLIGTQHASFELTPEVYEREIAPARTFALWEDIERLRAAGMIRGGTLQNAVVVQGDRLLDSQVLRFPDEFVRHKLLDFLGDLSLLGRPIRGHLHAVRSGHDTNVRFVQKLAEAMNGPRAYERFIDQPQFDINAIERIMPHRYPFLLVDRILLLEPARRVVGMKNVTINEPFFEGHFPGHPIMPGVLLLEAMAQAGGVLLLHTVEDPTSKLMYFLGIDNARFRRPVRPGDQLIFVLELVKLKGRICRMDGKAYVRGVLVAEAEFLSQVVDR